MQVQTHDTAKPVTPMRSALRWLVTFVGFPLGGLAAELITGPVDDLAAAVLGGAITGLILGAVQAWSLRPHRVAFGPWIAASGLGFAVGLGIGAAAVDYGTSAGDLAIQGAVCGVAIGLAQAGVLWARVGAVALVWPVALAALWALGWTVTTAIGVDVESQYTVFGSSGAIVVTIATAALPVLLAWRGERRVS